MSRRRIKGILHNFLGTYTSRYSDLEGYWLFGLSIADVSKLAIDLLNPAVGATESAPLAAAVRLAALKFREQLEKGRCDVLVIREARLDITKSPEVSRGLVNGRMTVGHNFLFVATAVTDLGRIYKGEMSVFVAPHDPGIERRSTRYVP